MQPGRQDQPAQKVIPAQMEQSDPKVTLEQPEPRAQKVIRAQLGPLEPLGPLVLLDPPGLRVRKVWLVPRAQKAIRAQPEQKAIRAQSELTERRAIPGRKALLALLGQ